MAARRRARAAARAAGATFRFPGSPLIHTSPPRPRAAAANAPRNASSSRARPTSGESAALAPLRKRLRDCDSRTTRVHRHRLAHAFQRVHAELLELETRADQRARRRARHERLRTAPAPGAVPRRSAPRRARAAPCAAARPSRRSPRGRCARPAARRCGLRTPASSSWFSASTRASSASPARSARSGSSSCATGWPKYTSTPSPRYCAIVPSACATHSPAARWKRRTVSRQSSGPSWARELRRSDEIREEHRELAVLRFSGELEPAPALVAEPRLGRIRGATARTLHAA